MYVVLVFSFNKQFGVRDNHCIDKDSNKSKNILSKLIRVIKLQFLLLEKNGFIDLI